MMRGKGRAWFFLLVLVVIISMMDTSAASKARARETAPKYKIQKTSKGYKTSFRSNGRVFYSVKTKVKPIVKFISTRKLTNHMILNRKQLTVIYVEIDNGTVLNRKKDGMDELGYYISYKRLKGVRKGSRVVSYFVYNPNNNYIDGIDGRCDYVVRK